MYSLCKCHLLQGIGLHTIVLTLLLHGHRIQSVSLEGKGKGRLSFSTNAAKAFRGVGIQIHSFLISEQME